MNTLIVTIITIMCISAFAQNGKIVNNAPDNYLNALKSSNEGVMESAIFLSLKYHLFYPDNDIGKLRREIEKISKNSNTDRVRYKAYLANKVFESPDFKSTIEKDDYKDANQFFTMVSKELMEYRLTSQ